MMSGCHYSSPGNFRPLPLGFSVPVPVDAGQGHTGAGLMNLDIPAEGRAAGSYHRQPQRLVISAQRITLFPHRKRNSQEEKKSRE